MYKIILNSYAFYIMFYFKASLISLISFFPDKLNSSTFYHCTKKKKKKKKKKKTPTPYITTQPTTHGTTPSFHIKHSEHAIYSNNPWNFANEELSFYFLLIFIYFFCLKTCRITNTAVHFNKKNKQTNKQTNKKKKVYLQNAYTADLELREFRL